MGDEFAIVTYGSRSGEFASVTGWTVGGLALVRLYEDNALLLHCTFFGDVNLDGSVDIADLGQVATYYGEQGVSWKQGDFNYDGVVDIADLGSLATNYGNTAGGRPIPEPGSAVLMACGVLGLLRRRARK